MNHFTLWRFVPAASLALNLGWGGAHPAPGGT